MAIHKNSPDYLFDPLSIGWLHRRAEQGLVVLNEEVSAIIAADPDLVPDPVLRDFIVRGLGGELKQKRGRKRTAVKELKELYAVARYEVLLPRMQALARERKSKGLKKGSVDFSPSEEACELIARELRLGSGENVRNILSRRNVGK